MEYRKVKKNIKSLMKKKGISVNELAKRLNLKPRFFAELQCIKIERLYDICAAIEVSPFQILEDENFTKYYDEKGNINKIEKKHLNPFRI